MIELPLWRECRKCTRFAKTADTPRCSDPFPTSGNCPHLGERELSIPYEYRNHPKQSHKYASLLDEDLRISSIFLRWRHGELPNDSDYLYIRALFFDSRYLMKDEAPYHFLFDIGFEPLTRITLDFCLYNLQLGAPGSPEYYRNELPQEISIEVTQVLHGSVMYILNLCGPGVIKANAKQKSDWSLLVIDIVRLLLWNHFKCKHIDFSNAPDKEFRRLLEKEWEVLKQYYDLYYGFRVLPRITNSDMVRYQNLSRGDEIMRREIGTYLSHRANAYPFWINIFTDKFREHAFEKPLRESYRPLINSLIHKAVKNLTSGQHGATNRQDMAHPIDQIKEALEIQLWEKFDEYLHNYKFHWDHPHKKRPIGKVGILGLQDKTVKKEIDRRLEEMGLPIRTEHFSEVSFAHYIHEKLSNWLETTYPADAPPEKTVSLNNNQDEHSPLIERVSGNEGWNADDNSLSPAHNVITGNDNIDYITINALAKRSGMSVHQLRRLDKQGLLPFTRVKNVCSKPWPLSADVRLYPLTDEAQKALLLAKVRLEKHSSQLEGSELDRKTVAQMLGISVGALRNWEEKGLVSPRRKGRIVVYDGQALQQAKLVKEQKGSK